MVNTTVLMKSLHQFTTDLYGQVLEQQTVAGNWENAFLSPLSIYVTCLIVMVGAAGKTLEEMQRTLHISPLLSDQQWHSTFGPVLINDYTQVEGIKLSIANRVFLLGQSNISSEYKAGINEFYKTDTESLQDKADLEAKRQHINQWVSNHTEDKIKELIERGTITDESILAIVNALYFRGLWKKQFSKNDTETGYFKLLNGSLKEIPMMSKQADFPIMKLDKLGAQAIKLPFSGSLYSMLIVLPDKPNGLEGLLTEMKKPDVLTSLLAEPFKEKEVLLRLPRFKISDGPVLNVKALLRNLGLISLFDSSVANLSKIRSENDLFVSEMLHKSVIEVDEEGAKAAASTVVIINVRSALFTPEFIVDHPFFMAVLYNSTPVFLGHIIEPVAN